MLTRLAKIQLLILDDLFLTPLDASQRNDLLEIIEDRYQKTPTVITSQCPIKDWHTIIGEPTVADGILGPPAAPCLQNRTERRFDQKDQEMIN